MAVNFTPVFVPNKNVRNFNVALAEITSRQADKGRFFAVSGRAGFGKTTAADRWHIEHPSVFLRMRETWRSSELPFLQELCRELGIQRPPFRKDAAFMSAVDVLIRRRTPVFVDEIDKFTPRQSVMFLEILRDLTDLTGAPVVCIGEEGLPSLMQQSTRVSSRTVRHLAFGPVGPADIITYARAATDGAVTLSPEVVQVFVQASLGDIRVVERDVENLVALINARGNGTGVDAELARAAVAAGLEVR